MRASTSLIPKSEARYAKSPGDPNGLGVALREVFDRTWRISAMQRLLCDMFFSTMSPKAYRVDTKLMPKRALVYMGTVCMKVASLLISRFRRKKEWR